MEIPELLLSQLAETSDYAKTGKPPKAILDDQGITHYNEIALRASYGEGECACGFHPLTSNSWYHSTLNLTNDHHNYIKIIRKCKKCHEILLRKKLKGEVR